MLRQQKSALTSLLLSGLHSRFRRLGSALIVTVAGLALVASATAATTPSRDRNYLYVASPSLGRQIERGGHGILVFDIDDHHTFVKRTPGWLTFSIDGRYAYPSTGEIIDAKSRKIIGNLVDEENRNVMSEKLMQIVFRDGRPIATGDQFGVGRAQPAPAD